MKGSHTGIETHVHEIDRRIESLKVKFNLYFSGELRVPPESEREKLEAELRQIQYRGDKTPRLQLLIQNVASKFTLYNNMWLKRVNEFEMGTNPLVKKADNKVKKTGKKIYGLSLNSEESFESFYDKYADLVADQSIAPVEREKVINSLKVKMITTNTVDARVSLEMVKGKVKIKIIK